MKKIYLLYTLLVLGSIEACDVRNSREYKNVNADKEFYEREMRKRDQELEEITRTMARIESNLLTIRENEGIVEVLQVSQEENKGERIDAMISEMGTYLKENKQLVTQLESKLKTALNKNAGLLALLAQQKRAILEKEQEIRTLRDSIALLQEELQIAVAAKDIEIVQRDRELYSQKKLISDREVALSSAFYQVGTKKELLAKNIIRYEGGVIGMGKTVQLTNRLNERAFKNVDIRQFNELEIGSVKKSKLLSTHPTDSYYFVKTDGRIYLHITNPNQFWSLSKFLVVVTD